MTFLPEDRAIQAERAIDRARAITYPCRYCTAPEGQHCFNPATGEPLTRMSAHLWRLQDCGLG